MSTGEYIFHRDDLNLIVRFAGCSLDESPGSNWVQEAGGLPDYICRIARAVKKTGKTTSRAIAIAVSRVKKWSAGVGVDHDTQVKAAAALAEWEKLKTTARAKSAGKNLVKASAATADPAVLVLANDYNVDNVRTAFGQLTRQQRSDWRTANPNADYYTDGPPSMYVKELWNTFLIAQSGYDDTATLYKVPYTVDTNGVSFGDATEVKTEYVAVPAGEVDDLTLPDTTVQALMATVPACQFSPLLTLSQPSALDRLLAHKPGE